MDEMRAAKQGGFRVISSEALPTISASTQIFANAPTGTAVIELTVRGQDINLTFDSTTASTTVGHIYPKDNTYRLVLSKAEALKVRGIQLAATATGYITYFGV